jgi:hypothetical protein
MNNKEIISMETKNTETIEELERRLKILKDAKFETYFKMLQMKYIVGEYFVFNTKEGEEDENRIYKILGSDSTYKSFHYLEISFQDKKSGIYFEDKIKTLREYWFMLTQLKPIKKEIAEAKIKEELQYLQKTILE